MKVRTEYIVITIFILMSWSGTTCAAKDLCLLPIGGGDALAAVNATVESHNEPTPAPVCSLDPESSLDPEKDRKVTLTKILHKIVGDDFQAFLGFEPSIEIINSPKLNAYALSPNRLVLSSGLLKIAKSDSELAFILAHELSHLILRHKDYNILGIPSGNKQGRESAKHLIDQEIEADLAALSLLKDSPYDIGEITELLTRMGEVSYGDTPPLKTSYPSLKIRIANINGQLGTKQKPQAEARVAGSYGNRGLSQF